MLQPERINYKDMASVKILFFKHKMLEDGTSPIVLQIIHKRIRRVFSLNYSTFIERWNDDVKEIKVFDKSQKHFIKEKNFYFKGMLLKANQIILDFEKAGLEFSADDIIQKLKGTESSTFKVFTQKIIDELEEQGKYGNATCYKRIQSVFSKFLNDKDISFDQIDYATLKKFETFMLKKGNKVNTVAFEFRTLRAVYNRAIKEGLAKKELYPFDKYKIKTEKTQKRALSKDEIISIRDIDLEDFPGQKKARDLFMFSFYTMGMSFVDIAYLKVRDVRKGRLNYSRKKTTQKYSMAILEPAMEIINRYSDLKDPDAFLFPLLNHEHEKIHELYRSCMRNQNRRLQEVGKKLELSLPLTSYVARHSWATIAKRSGVPTAVISEGLGHTTENTTQIYLDSFENEVLDAANRLITL
ncbi:MAG: site-specific integrase [Bacteroidales bacterium]|nr:site-specific integrase [Bacteroidales bacterium]